MYRRLLVAVDGSDRATAAANHAIEIAVEVDAALEFVYIIDVRPVYSHYGLAALPTENEIDVEHERGKSIIDRCLDRASKAGISADGTVIRGTPHLKIIEQADAVKADAIVIGRPKHRPFGRLFGVSTVDRVLKNADRTVIVVRGSSETPH